MSSSAVCTVQLVLLLTASSFSDADSSTTEATATTTQNLNPETTPNNASSLPETSASDPPNLPFMKDNITISGFLKESLVKNITLESPSELELLCSLAIKPSMDVEQVEVAWRRGNETISESILYRNETQTSWCTRYEVKVRTRDQMGNYTCVYKTKPEIKATFHLQVPEAHRKSKDIISYVGDFVVLVCIVGNETSHSIPSSWVWFTKNGSEQVAINTTLMPEKYSVIQEYANITKLKISALSEEDTGVYRCSATFPLGESSEDVSLKVLTYITPLKPFLAIAAEVIIFVAIIFAYEICTKKKEETHEEVEKEFEQTETLKSEDSNGVENSTTRHRKA